MEKTDMKNTVFSRSFTNYHDVILAVLNELPRYDTKNNSLAV